MSKELLWLTLTVILTGLMWVPYILDRIIVRGMMGAMANPFTATTSRNQPGPSGSISLTPTRSKI